MLENCLQGIPGRNVGSLNRPDVELPYKSWTNFKWGWTSHGTLDDLLGQRGCPNFCV